MSNWHRIIKALKAKGPFLDCQHFTDLRMEKIHLHVCSWLKFNNMNFGKLANDTCLWKYDPLVITDETENHKRSVGDTCLPETYAEDIVQVWFGEKEMSITWMKQNQPQQVQPGEEQALRPTQHLPHRHS
jgi:hypothetical protein